MCLIHHVTREQRDVADGGGGVVVHRVGPRVAEQHLQAIGEAFGDRCLERVVIGVGVALHQVTAQSRGRQIAESREERSAQIPKRGHARERGTKRLIEREQAWKLASH